MARQIDLSKSLYQAGPVRVVKRREREYRILWTEAKRQRERQSTNFDRAKAIAQEEAIRLWSEGEQPSDGRMSFGALVSIAADPKHHSWTERWATNVDSIVRLHIMPHLGEIPVSEIARQDIAVFLGRMAEEGYSHHFLTHVRNVIKLAVDEGIQREIWDGARHPLVKVTVPRNHVTGEDGKPDLAMIPTDQQVTELIERMFKDRQVYGAMAAAAAYSGVRRGELLALNPDVINLTTHRLAVELNCVEHAGRYTFRAPAKRSAKRREVVIEPILEAVLRSSIDTLPTEPLPCPNVDGPDPGRRLFTTANGNPFSRGNHTKVFWRHARKIKGWPERATWHYLRHYAATRWIRLGVEVPTVSVMLGHSQISTTYNWYVNVDAAALGRAADTLRLASPPESDG